MKANGKKQAPALHMGRRFPTHHKWNEHDFTIPAETPMETVLDPHYWRHYTADLKPSDIMNCFCDDGSWEASFRVMTVDRAMVKISLRWKAEHEKVELEESDTHEIKWGGPAVKFKVVRKDSGEVLKDNLYPKSEAHNFLQRHLQSVQG